MTFDQLWAGWRSEYVNKVADEIRAQESDVTLHAATQERDENILKSKSGKVKAAEEDGLSLQKGNDLLAAERECVFCRIAAIGHPDKDGHLVYIGSYSMALLNAYPYGTGHMLVMPRKHIGDISELSEEGHADLWKVCRLAIEALRKAYNPDGFNMGANLGRAAGAGIPEHLHFHVLPRWTGDTSFMTSIASTRVLPESLDLTFDKILTNWVEYSE